MKITDVAAWIFVLIILFVLFVISCLMIGFYVTTFWMVVIIAVYLHGKYIRQLIIHGNLMQYTLYGKPITGHYTTAFSILNPTTNENENDQPTWSAKRD